MPSRGGATQKRLGLASKYVCMHAAWWRRASGYVAEIKQKAYGEMSEMRKHRVCRYGRIIEENSPDAGNIDTIIWFLSVKHQK